MSDSVSIVTQTCVKPESAEAFARWQGETSTVITNFPGFIEQRLMPPKPPLQIDWVILQRFASRDDAQRWLASPERHKLIAEAEPLTDEFHTRTVRAGFEQWFREAGAGAAPLPVWKMDMLVLLMLYPIVFLFGVFVATPFLINRLALPFAISLFLGNIVSVGLTGFLVPWVANRFGWWLHPKGSQPLRTHLLGAGIIAAMYAIMVVAFWRLF